MSNLRLKIVLVALCAAILSACGKATDTAALEAKVRALEADKAQLAQQVNELAETEPNLLQRCKEAAGKSDASASRTRAREVEDAVKLCTNFANKYPNSPQAAEVAQIIEQKRSLLRTFAVLGEVEQLAGAGHLEEAVQRMESLRGKINDDFIDGILTDIRKAQNRPARVSYRELHKLASTGMTIEKPYQVEADLTPNGKYLCLVYGNGACLDPDTILRFSENLTIEESRRLYDLRGKSACFTVHMGPEGILMVDEATPGKCGT